MAFIEIKSLCKNYQLGDAAVQALSDVSFVVQEGESCAIVGKSGAGKSTLARILVGRSRPSSGTVCVAGIDVTSLLPRQMKGYWRSVQLVGQDPKATFDPRRKVADALTETLSNFDVVPHNQAKSRSIDLLETVGLDASFLPRYPHEMSGGQLQRLSIARALACEPRMLVLDEPTSALDSVTQRLIVDLLADLKSRFGLTYLAICHDLGLAQLLAERVIVMKDGCVVDDLSSAELASSSHDYTQTLLAAEQVLSL